MKNSLFRNVSLLALTISWLFVTRSLMAQAESAPPVITVQPSPQTAAHGTNVMFTVTASGTSLQYQWQKDGKELADYGNVSGAKTATLKLVGVAQVDVADYTVVVSNESGVVTSAIATLKVNSIMVFSDDFEQGALSNWKAFSELPGLQNAFRQTPAEKKLNPVSLGSMAPQAIRLTNSSAQNHTPGGSRSALLNHSLGKMYHNLGVELAGQVKATFWIYDDDGAQARCYGELRGYSGSGHAIYVAPSGMKQLFAIGRYGTEFGTTQTGSLRDEKRNIKKYQGKVERGANRGWFNLDDAPDRSVGWHEFQIVRDADGTTVHFYVDGHLGRTITKAEHVLLDCVTIGSVGMGTGVGEAWFDDVKVEAFPWRYDWQSKDSEGKGIFDWMKLRETGDDPQVTNVRQISTISQVDATGFTRALGPWETKGAGVGGIYAQNMRGAVEYSVNAPAADTYRIEIEGGERRGKIPIVKLPLKVWIDGEYLGRFILPYDGKTNGFVHCFTPFLAAGPHTIQVYWDNAENKCALYLQSIRLQSLAGADLNGNGFKDWAENRVLAQSGLDTVPTSSRVSPVCIEGRGQYLSLMKVNRSADGSSALVPVQPGAGYRWYANIPLSALGGTKIEVSHQNGVLEQTAEINWEVTNLLEAKDTVIRKGDSLLFTAAVAGAALGRVNINVIGITNYTGDTAAPIAHRFDQPGTFTVTGIFLSTGAARSITVKVVEASFGGNIAAWVGKRRFWDMESLPPEVALYSDPRLSLTLVSAEERAQQKPTPPPLGVNGRQYSITNDAAETRYVVARLG
ncbi:MAG: immunoglobulin domain-containing protein, partial [Limisphaerales bacterium]